MAPMYLQDFLQVKTPGRYSLRSYALCHLKVPRTWCKTFEDRVFVALPRFWNNGPLAIIRESEFIDNFTRNLKTPTWREFVFSGFWVDFGSRPLSPNAGSNTLHSFGHLVVVRHFSTVSNNVE